METFETLAHAQEICQLYRRQYNRGRPHSSLAYLTPDEFVVGAAGAGSSTRPRAPYAFLHAQAIGVN